MPLGSLAPNAQQTGPAARPQRTPRSPHVSCPFSNIGLWLPCEETGLHKSSLGLYNYPFLAVSGNVIKKGKTKNPGAEKESSGPGYRAVRL